MTEFLNFECELKAEGPQGVITGYASTFNNADLVGDVIEPGAFAATLAKRGGRPFPLLWAHDMSAPLGAWRDVHEDSKGLLVTGKLTMSVPRAREAFDLITDGAVRGLSIGFNTKQAVRERGGMRRIQEVDLREISLVALPANEEATILTAKSVDLNSVRTLERILRDAGYSRAEAKAICAGGFKNLSSDLRDAEPDELKELVEAVRALTSSLAPARTEADDERRADHGTEVALDRLRRGRG